MHLVAEKPNLSYSGKKLAKKKKRGYTKRFTVLFQLLGPNQLNTDSAHVIGLGDLAKHYYHILPQFVLK